MELKNQELAVMNFIKEHGSINRWQAQDIGILHLGDRILHLRRKGFKIDMNKKTVKNRYGNYSSYGVYTLAEEK